MCNNIYLCFFNLCGATVSSSKRPGGGRGWAACHSGIKIIFSKNWHNLPNSLNHLHPFISTLFPLCLIKKHPFPFLFPPAPRFPHPIPVPPSLSTTATFLINHSHSLHQPQPFSRSTTAILLIAFLLIL